MAPTVCDCVTWRESDTQLRVCIAPQSVERLHAQPPPEFNLVTVPFARTVWAGSRDGSMVGVLAWALFTRHDAYSRYEQCMREKEDIAAKLQMLEKGGAGSQRSADLLKRYQDLKDEYKLYRKKAMEALQEKDIALTQAQAELNMGVRSGPGMRRAANAGGGRGGGAVGDDPRMTYLKNLMLKYLCVDELEVRRRHREYSEASRPVYRISKREWRCGSETACGEVDGHRIPRSLADARTPTGEGAHGARNIDGPRVLRR